MAATVRGLSWGSKIRQGGRGPRQPKNVRFLAARVGSPSQPRLNLIVPPDFRVPLPPRLAGALDRAGRTDGELVHDQRLSAILYHGNGGGGIVVHAGRGHIVALARALDPMRRMLSKAPEKLSILDTLPD